MPRKNISSGAPWESKYAYSRMVLVNKRAYVSGTTAVDEEGNIQGPKDAYKQTKFIFNKIDKIIQENDFTKEDIVRSRMYVTSMLFSDEVGRAHGEYFNGINPAATMVEITALIDKDMLVEIEVDLEKS